MGTLETKSGYPRPDFPTVLERNRQDGDSRLGPHGFNARLDFGLLSALVYGSAVGEHNNYGHIDRQMDECLVQTATGFNLERIAAQYGIIRHSATYARGEVSLSGAAGAVLAKGAILKAGNRDGNGQYVTRGAVTLDENGSAIVEVQALKPGHAFNLTAGTGLALMRPTIGLDPKASVILISGGTDPERDGKPYDPALGTLRGRAWLRMRNPPKAGNNGDWLRWVSDVPGVTRAWISPFGQGGGTVLAYVMMDANPDGRPAGIDNLTSVGPTGDYETIVNHLLLENPSLTRPKVMCPTLQPLDITIADLRSDASNPEQAVRDALDDVIREYATPPAVILDPPRPHIPAGEIPVSLLWEAVAKASGERAHKIISPTDHVLTDNGSLRTLGTVAFI